MEIKYPSKETEKDRLPYDIGSQAYADRLLPEDNPYPEDDWRHEEWYLGSHHSEESDSWSYDFTTGKFNDHYDLSG